MRIKTGLIAGGSITAAVVGLWAVISFVMRETPTPVITGMVEVAEIDISSKIPGRIDSLFIEEGDTVAKGQMLALLADTEVKAKVEQARGAMEAARAKMDIAHNGARPEQKTAVEKVYLQAKHQFQLAEKSFLRIQRVYKDSVISDQEYDTAEFKFKAAREQMDAAKAQYDLVVNGARSEEVRAAEALFYQASHVFEEAASYFDETRIESPVDGVVFSKIADRGEMIPAGYPVITILDLNDSWIVINVREDQIGSMQPGKLMSGTVPSLGGKQIALKVTYSASMADFATWKATNEKNRFDLKTFEVHLRPVEPAAELLPGMTVRINMDNE